MQWVQHGVRFVLVTVGIVVLTSVTIDATDTFRGSQSALSILARNATERSCPAGMVPIDLGDRSFCIDAYESSASAECPSVSPAAIGDTQLNLNDVECNSTSDAQSVPWTHINYHQAKVSCVKRGARLPSPQEWYEAALGTPDSNVCNVSGNRAETGSFPRCQSGRGAYDMVGNVWEWVDVTIEAGTYSGRTLPAEGYVTEADGAGVAVATANRAEPLYGEDYFWTTPEGTRVMMRGGFYGSASDAGVYAVHTKVEPSFSSAAIGFRCVVDR